MEKMKMSIVIPASNAEQTIERCIDSIYDNQHTDIECIVVVNNSSDNTLKICEALKEKHLSLVVINAQAKGVSEARNKGLAHVSGSVIGFCDADDFYEPNAIDAVAQKMSQYSADIVMTGLYRTKIEHDEIIKQKPSVIFHNKMIRVNQAQGLVLNHQCVMGSVWNKFYRKEILSGIRFDKELTHCEDTHFNMQVLKNENLRILLSDIISYNYVSNPSSATRNIDRCYTKDNKLKYLIAIEKIQTEYAGNSHVKKETAYAMVALSVDNYLHSLSIKRKKNLRENITHNFWYLFRGFFKYGMKRNVKRFIKCILILLNLI